MRKTAIILIVSFTFIFSGNTFSGNTTNSGTSECPYISKIHKNKISDCPFINNSQKNELKERTGIKEQPECPYKKQKSEIMKKKNHPEKKLKIV